AQPPASAGPAPERVRDCGERAPRRGGGDSRCAAFGLAPGELGPVAWYLGGPPRDAEPAPRAGTRRGKLSRPSCLTLSSGSLSAEGPIRSRGEATVLLIP